MYRRLRILVVAFIYFVLLCAIACADTLEQTKVRLEGILGDARSTPEHKEAALKEAEHDLLEHPSDPEAVQLLDSVVREMRSLQKTRLADEAATQAGGSKDLTLSFYGWLLLSQSLDAEVQTRAYERLIETCDRIRALPDDSPVRASMSAVLDAASDARRWYGLACAWQAQGRPDRAMPWLEKTAAWGERAGDPIAQDALRLLVECQRGLGKREQAEATLRRLRASCPGVYETELDFQEDLLRLRVEDQTSLQFARALDELFRAELSKGGLPEEKVRKHRAWLGNLYFANGEYSHAAAEYDEWMPLLRRRIARARPGIYEVLPDLEFAAEAHARLGHPDRAQELLSLLFDVVAGMAEQEWRRDALQVLNLKKAVAIARELAAARGKGRRPDIGSVLAEQREGQHAQPNQYRSVTEEDIRGTLAAHRKDGERR